MGIENITNKFAPGTGLYDSALKYSRTFQKQQIQYVKGLGTADILGNEVPKILAGQNPRFSSLAELDIAMKKAAASKDTNKLGLKLNKFKENFSTAAKELLNTAATGISTFIDKFKK